MKKSENTELLLQNTRKINNNTMYENEINDINLTSNMTSSENISDTNNFEGIKQTQIHIRNNKNEEILNVDLNRVTSHSSKKNYHLPTVHSLKIINELNNKNEDFISDDYDSGSKEADLNFKRNLFGTVSEQENANRYLKTDCNLNPVVDKSCQLPSYKTSIENKRKILNSILPPLTNIDLAKGEKNDDSDNHQGTLTSFPTMKPNRSIYKLAYDESLTDQSETEETNSSSNFFDLSKTSELDIQNPEYQVPSSITSAEILIHEADTASEAGSEDVELLPHRYESESFLNDSKHMYVNKLSLAVELLRTRETLPYDDDFKRVEGEKNGKLANTYPGVTENLKSGFVNKIFVNDQHGSTETETLPIGTTNELVIVSEKHDEIHSTQPKQQTFQLEEHVQSLENSWESAHEACEAQCTERQRELWTEADGVRASYFRFGVHAQHRFNIFSPRTSVNPCFCCIIM